MLHQLAMGVRRYEDLRVWQQAMRLHEQLVAATATPDIARDFSFCDQLRSSSASVAGNIAEGFGRYSRPEFARFLRYARGSLFETQVWLRDGRLRGYFTAAESERLYQLSEVVAGSLTSLLRTLSNPR